MVCRDLCHAGSRQRHEGTTTTLLQPIAACATHADEDMSKCYQRYGLTVERDLSAAPVGGADMGVWVEGGGEGSVVDAAVGPRVR